MRLRAAPISSSKQHKAALRTACPHVHPPAAPDNLGHRASHTHTHTHVGYSVLPARCLASMGFCCCLGSASSHGHPILIPAHCLEHGASHAGGPARSKGNACRTKATFPMVSSQRLIHCRDLRPSENPGSCGTQHTVPSTLIWEFQH